MAEGACAGRLPQQVVLNQARARPAGELGERLADAFVEHGSRNFPVGLPAVADLARERRVARAVLPVDLVGPDAGLEVASEQAREALAQDRRGAPIDQALDHEEAVLAEARDLVLGQ